MNSLTFDVSSTNSIKEAYNVVAEGIKILKNGGEGESSYESEELRQRYMALFFRMVQARGLEYNPQILMICNM